MKNREFLNMLGDIDAELIEDAAPSLEKKAVSARNKQKTGWVKYAAIAACCALILSGVMISGHLFDVIINPNVGESSQHGGDGDQSGDVNFPAETDGRDDEIKLPQEEWTEDQEFPGDYAGTDLNDEETFGEEEMPDYYISGTISEGVFSSYSIVNYICAEDRVGDSLGDVIVTFNNPYEGNTYTVGAEVFSVLDINQSYCLCLRYIDDGVSSFVDDYVEYDKYYLLVSETNNFALFSGVREEYFGGKIEDMNTKPIYYKDTDELYCPNFDISGDALSLILRMLNEIDGEAVVDHELVDKIHADSVERLTFYYLDSPLKDIVHNIVYIYGEGYLYFQPFGGRMFNIGEAAAREIIDTVLYKSKPIRFVWNESEEKWYPITSVNVSDYCKTFKELMEKSELLDNLKFENKVDYYEQHSGFGPNYLMLDDKLLSALAEILYIADGDGVNKMSSAYSERISFWHLDDQGKELNLEVYDNGYIRCMNVYYFVGTDYTDKIIYNVKTDGKAPDDFYWNNKEECWQTYAPDEEEKVEIDETSSAESVDYGYGSDVYEKDR